MTDLDARAGQRTDHTGFSRPFLAWTAVVTAVLAVWQAVDSRTDARAHIRVDWLTDALAVVLATVVFAAVAAAVGVWALRGPRPRAARTVVGLVVLAALLLPVGWWSGAPIVVALGAVLLARAAGVGTTGGPRAAVVVAKLVVVALFAFRIAANVADRV